MNNQSKIQKMRTLYQSGEPLPLEWRLDKLNKLKDAIDKNKNEIKVALKNDLGKSSFESFVSEIGFVVDEIKSFTKHLADWHQPQKVSTPLPLQPAKSLVYREAFGVVLILGPWNYPFQLSFSPLIGAIAAGNRVVIKPSEFAVATAQIIEKIVKMTFSDDEVLVVQGGVQETQEILKQRFDYIFFTGSTKVGKIVMKAAAENLTPLTLELGGKSPCVVDETAHLKNTAKRIVWGKFMNAGQTCVAPDYLFVHESVKTKLIEELKNVITQFYGSDPSQSPDFGRIINEAHFSRLIKLMADGKPVMGGESNQTSKYIAPTILENVDPNSALMQEEIFGPLLPLFTYKNWNEVISFIKDRPKPLAAYFFSEDSKKQDDWIKRVSFGGGCLNDTVIHLANPELPFGGVGESGMGAYHGQRSFEIFSHHKAVLKQTNLIDVPLRYPPYKNKEDVVKYIIG